ncbi:hypothetical protein PUN28_001405 [Cardiocondyla obscurior]|uniref:Uncharacterized protein n=1 Tax=Cardiocondyla obscurior TaxID=286306 RepID=A0AAW2H5H0_9HYME
MCKATVNFVSRRRRNAAKTSAGREMSLSSSSGDNRKRLVASAHNRVTREMVKTKSHEESGTNVTKTSKMR